MEYGAIGVWLALVGGLWLVGLPLAGVLFARFPDRGVAFGLPVALAVVGIVVSLVGQLSMIAGIAAGLLALALGVLLGFRYDTRLSPRALVGPVVVFVLAFGLMIAIRGFDPAVHPGGGEKFLDFGLLKSVIRADRLPPEDVWFAGSPVQYYYGGHLIAGVLARLSGIDARFAYNLALSTFYAAVVTAAYGLAGAIADRHGASRLGAGAFAAFFVGLASNLEPAGKALLWALPDDPSQTITGWLGIERTGLIHAPADFGYWGASRVIPAHPGDPNSYMIPTEFPLFGWLNGDLHAHMMSTPFLLLAAAVCYAYFLTPAESVWRRRALIFGALPPVVGLLGLVNTWSLPTAVGLGWLSLTFARSSPATLLGERVGRRLRTEGGWLRREASHTGVALVCAVLVLVIGLCWTLPFWLGSASARSLAFLPDRTPLGPLLLVTGGFLVVIAPYLVSRLGTSERSTPKRILIGTGAVVATVVWLAVVGYALDLAAVAVFGPLLVGGWVLLRRRGRPGRFSDTTHGAADTTERRETRRVAGDGDGLGRRAVGFEAVLLIACAGLIILVEFAYVNGHAGPGRFNTVFKVYAQVWMLLSVAVGTMAGITLTTTKPVSAWRRASVGHLGRALTDWRYVGVRLLLAGVVVSTAIYGGLALSEQFTEDHRYKPDQPTLDALAFVGTAHPDEAAAIGWLDDRTGQPTIVSAPGTNAKGLRIYRWINAPSSLTGVPTVAGWVEETGYRDSDAYFQRVNDVKTIFTGAPAQQRRLLAKYDVQYIYVGPKERSYYGDSQFGSLPGVEVEKQLGAVTIYAVTQDELDA